MMVKNKNMCLCENKGYCIIHSKYRIAFLYKSPTESNLYFGSFFKDEKKPPKEILEKAYRRLKTKVKPGEINIVAIYNNGIPGPPLATITL